jgi:hypothetical protein
LNRTPVGEEIRAKIEKWDHIRLKSFYTAKETITSLQNWRKIFTSYSSNRELKSIIYFKNSKN